MPTLTGFVNLPGAPNLNQILGYLATNLASQQSSESGLLDFLLKQQINSLAQEIAVAKQRQQDQEARTLVQALLKEAFVVDQQRKEEQRRQESEIAGKLTLALLAVASAGNQ